MHAVRDTIVKLQNVQDQRDAKIGLLKVSEAHVFVPALGDWHIPLPRGFPLIVPVGLVNICVSCLLRAPRGSVSQARHSAPYATLKFAVTIFLSCCAFSSSSRDGRATWALRA